MPKKGPGKRYTREEAEGRIPTVAKRVALEAIDLIIAMDKHSLTSQEIERRLWSLSGQTGYLSRLFHVVWRSEGLRRAREQGAA